MGGTATPSTLISHLGDGIMIRLHPCSCSHILHCCMKFDTRLGSNSTQLLSYQSSRTWRNSSKTGVWHGCRHPANQGCRERMTMWWYGCRGPCIAYTDQHDDSDDDVVDDDDNDWSGGEGKRWGWLANALHKILFFTFPRQVHCPSETAQKWNQRIQHLIFSPTEP